MNIITMFSKSSDNKNENNYKERTKWQGSFNDRLKEPYNWLERVNNQIDLIAQRAKNILGFVMVKKGIWKQIWRLNVINTFKSIKSSLHLPQRPQWSLENSGYWISLGILHKWTYIGLSFPWLFCKKLSRLHFVIQRFPLKYPMGRQEKIFMKVISYFKV